MVERLLASASFALVLVACASSTEIVVDDAGSGDDGSYATSDDASVDNGYGYQPTSGGDDSSLPGDDSAAVGYDSGSTGIDAWTPDVTPPPFDSAPPPPLDAGSGACDITNQKYVNEYIQALQANMVKPCPCPAGQCCFDMLGCVAL